MNYFKVGTNFDNKLITGLAELNKVNANAQVNEVYGSDKAHAHLTARPDFRLKDITNKEFESYVKLCNDNAIKFNYTMNSMYPYGSKVNIVNNINGLVDFVHYLEDIGVHRITVANPIMLEIIRNYAKSNIEIEISTCMHIDAISQIKYLYQNYGVKKFCGNIIKNRQFKFLENAAKYCADNGLIYELMANEFCGVGGVGYSTHCVFRDSCYLCHATNKTKEDAELLNNYPMNNCMGARNSEKENWLRMRFIRPEDLKYYNNIGLHNFKITGRTGTTEYILKTTKAYMEGKFDGNLLELWKPLESIYNGKTEKDTKTIFIPNNKLDGFIEHWTNNKEFDCANEVCGETCKYCYNKSKEI